MIYELFAIWPKTMKDSIAAATTTPARPVPFSKCQKIESAFCNEKKNLSFAFHANIAKREKKKFKVLKVLEARQYQ